MSSPVYDVKSKENREHYFDGHWIRKATQAEEFLEAEHQKGHFLVWYQLNLNSKAPLQGEDVEKALGYLYRKVPNLGLSLAIREGPLWAKRPSNPNIDFKIVQGQTVEQVRDSLRNYHYNSETGPLFCGRLLEGSANNFSNLEDLDSHMQYKYYMFFGFHHGTVDGYTCMCIMGFFNSLLNDIISDKHISNKPLGIYKSDKETLTLVEGKRANIEYDSSLRENLSNEKEIHKNNVPYIISGFSGTDEGIKTVSLDRILDQSTTSKLLQKCRQEKVTFNSAFTGILSVALIDILVENGVIKDSYLIQNFHLVNTRRYWSTKEPLALGCHVGGPLFLYTETQRNVSHKFWDFVRASHQTLKKEIDSGRVLLDKAFDSLTSTATPLPDQKLHPKMNYKGDFLISNMGDVTPLVGEEGEHVRINHVLRSTTNHMTENPIVLHVHSFRGKFTMVFNYNPAAVHPDVAEKFCCQIMKRLYASLE